MKRRIGATVLTFAVALGLLTWVLDRLFQYPQPQQVEEEPASGSG
jgi:hypothetical protein